MTTKKPKPAKPDKSKQPSKTPEQQVKEWFEKENDRTQEGPKEWERQGS